MRKLGSSSGSNAKASQERLLGAPLSDDQVVGHVGGQAVTGKDVREAEEFGAYMDELVALFNYVHEHPEDKEAAERLTLNVQYLQKHHLFQFLDVAFTLWQAFRNMTKNS